MNDQDSIYKKSCDLVLPYIRIDGKSEYEDKYDPDKAESCLNEAIKGFEEVINLDPENWSAFWFLGKSYQALKQDQKSYECFKTAHSLNLTHQDVMRELALQCLRTKRYDSAVYYCQAALEFSPKDFTLISNLAVSKMFQGQLEQATEIAEKCLSLLPNDEPSLEVLRIIKDIKDGKRNIPNDFDELERGEPNA